MRLGFDVNKSTIDGWAPINIAAFKGDLHIVKALIAAGADIGHVESIAVNFF